MGRKPTKNTNLPPRMRRRVQRSGRVFYYYDAGGKPRKEIPLGSDYVFAVQRWAELEADSSTPAPTVIFRDAALRYVRDVLPSKAQHTREDNIKELEVLYEFFDNPPAALELIEPQHICQYRTWRIERTRARLRAQGKDAPADAGGVRANRELALFSHIFNYAREMGLTSAPNPSAGVRKTRETGRDVYVEDDVYSAVYAAADQPLRDAMDLAYLTGQRPADTLGLDERDVRDGALEIQQGKTGKKLRITIEGELAAVITRIRLRKASYKIVATALIVNERGQPLDRDALRSRFDKARETAGVPKNLFQFRDLRAKAGTDKADSAGDIRQAQRQLGHTSVAMTEHYVRNRRGEKVGPTK
ncbi:tyrosine-type recombinase/integrase [Alcaligenes sp. WGS1538]|uniref:tyrosine-type recombinase/integrase n=1 Tax=Alcaligenes sp. WGS1538 TaxID=3366811 RepID=UPI00372D1515